MPFLIEHLTEVVFVLFVMVLLGNLFLVGIVLTRRQRRRKFFQRIDALREKYGSIVPGVLSGQIPYVQGLQELRGISGSDRMSMLERLCLERKPAPGQEPVLRRLSEDLGLVKIWQQRLMGQIDPASIKDALADPGGLVERVSTLQFLIRAKSAENLGLIRHEPSWPLLVKALEDSHPDLQSVAARSLSAIGYPGSFPALVAQLHKVVLASTSALSVRAIKAALVSFPLENADEFLPSLRHPNPRIRFLSTDIIREMVEREAAGKTDFCLDRRNLQADLAEVFLVEMAFDENPDVRARAAAVISYLADPRAVPLLLTLLEDAAWFVRLHAVRALAKRRFLSQAGKIAGALTDPNWRVREAAVRTLRSFGPVGRERLTEHFLRTDDRYSREQIADEFQRAGLIPDLLLQCAENGNGREARVLGHLAEMGKTSYIVSVLTQGKGNGRLRKKFLQEFGGSPDPQIQHWIEMVAQQEPDSELRALAQAALSANHQHGEG